MMWRNKEVYTSLDQSPICGLFFLDGDVISRANGIDWTRGMKSSAIIFPSGLMCEIENSPAPHIFLCGGLSVPFHGTRENAFDVVLAQDESGEYSLFKAGDTQLELWHHETETVWFIVYDNYSQHVIDVFVTEPY